MDAMADAAADSASGGVGYAPIGEEVENFADSGLMRVESMCVDCGENGLTTLLPTTIPFFKRVIVTAFACEHCFMKNTNLQVRHAPACRAVPPHWVLLGPRGR